MKMRKQSWKIVFFLALASVPFASGLWAFSHINAYYAAAATLPREIQAARQEGLPLTPDDLRRSPPVADSENAAYLYAQLPSVKVDLEKSECLAAVIKGTATELDRKAARQLLAKAAPQLHLVEQAVALPDCDFHRKWRMGELIFPESASVRETTYLLSAQAVLQCESGHPEAALHTIRIGARMAQDMGKDPFVFALGKRISLEASMDRLFQRIIKKYADRPDVLRLAIQTERAFGETPDFGYALRGEVVDRRIMVETIRRGGLSSCTPLPFTGAPLGVVANAFEAHSVSYWRRVFSALNSTRGDLMATYRAAQSVYDAEEAMEETKGGKQKPTYEFAAVLCPPYAGMVKKVAANEAQRRMRRTLLTLLAYRQQKGCFPETLSQLSPAALEDPFLNQPFHYRRTEQGFLLYSVGPDLKDDGGNGTPEKQGDLPPDIVVSF